MKRFLQKQAHLYVLLSLLAACDSGSSPQALQTFLGSNAPQGAIAPTDVIAFAMPQLDFDANNTSGNPQNKTIAITNTMDKPLYLGDLVVKKSSLNLTDEASAAFTVASSNCPKFDKALAIGDTCSFVIKFAPQGSGTYIGEFELPYGESSQALTKTASFKATAYISTEAASQSNIGKLDIDSGNFQTTSVNSIYPQPLVVKLTKVDGTPIANETITYTVIAGEGGALSTANSTTDANGLASVVFTAGYNVGVYGVKAQWAKGNQSASFGLFTTAAYADINLNAITSTVQTGTVLTAFAQPLTVILTKTVNGVPQVMSNESVVFTVTQGSGAKLNSASTPQTVVTDASGNALVIFTAGATTGTYKVKASWKNNAKTVEFNLIASSAATGNPTLAIDSGNLQTAAVNTQYAAPLVVNLLRADGSPFANETVAFSIIAGGGGSLSATSVTTDANGQASVHFTAGYTVGAYGVKALWTAGNLSVSFGLFTTAAYADVTLAPASSTVQSGPVSSTFSQALKVLLTKEVAGATQVMANESIVFTITSGTGALLNNASTPQTVTTDASGFAQVTFKSGSSDGTYKVKASWQSDAKTVEFNLIASAPTGSPSLTIESGNLQTTAINTAFTSALVVKLTKADGSAFAGETIAYSVIAGSGGSFNSSSVTTDSNGLATVTFTAGYTIGAYGVKATWAAGNLSVSFGLFTTQPNADMTLTAVTSTVQSGNVSTTFSQPLKVMLTKDVSGVPQAVANQSIVFTITTGTGAQLNSLTTPQTVTTDSNGYAQVTFTAGATAGVYKVTAGWNSDAKTVEFSLIASVAAPQYVLKIVQNGTGSQPKVNNLSMQTGASITVKAALFDLNGNYIEDATALWSLSGATFPATDLTPVYTSSGTATFTPSTVGTTIINASYTGSNVSVASTTDSTGAITVDLAGTPTTIAIQSGDGQTAAAHNTITLKVRVKDQFNRDLPGANVTFAATTGGGSIVSANPAATDASGIATATAQLGNTAGINNYTATVTGYGSLYVTFTATATAGSASIVTFTTQPSNAWANAPFGQQPVVTIRDAYQNLVNASGTITLSIATGSGALTGTTTATLNAGVAIFSNVGWNTANAAAQLRATYGAVTGDSAVFVVNSAPPGACQSNDARFSTGGGGCQDLSTGLIWSSKSASAMIWYKAIWDKFNPAGNSNTADAYDYGRTNDYDPDTPLAFFTNSYLPDSDITNYCKSLVEGGQSDWRLPTNTELMQVSSNAIAGTPPYLASTASENIWTSSFNSLTASYAKAVNITNATSTNVTTSSTLKVYCVRGRWAASDRLEVESAPTGILVNSTSSAQSIPLIVRLKDSLGNKVNAQGVTLTISSTSLGALGGTLSAQTDSLGRATFDNFRLDTTGDATLTITSSGLTSVTQTIKVINTIAHVCKVDDIYFQTAQGGCKHIASGKVWSLPAVSLMTWHDAIWGYVAGSFNTADPPDANDGSRLNDYDPTALPVTAPDASNINYCHQLVEGGYSDWRVPTNAEMLTVNNSGINGSKQHFAFNTDQTFWTSSTYGSDSSQAVLAFNFFTSATTYGLAKNTQARTICIRP